MTITTETRIIDLTVGQLENIFEKASKQPALAKKPHSKPMTTVQLSEFLDMPLPTIYYKVKQGGMPHIKEGGKLYFLEDQIMTWLKANQRSSIKDLAETSFEEFKQKLIAKK